MNNKGTLKTSPILTIACSILLSMPNELKCGTICTSNISKGSACCSVHPSSGAAAASVAAAPPLASAAPVDDEEGMTPPSRALVAAPVISTAAAVAAAALALSPCRQFATTWKRRVLLLLLSKPVQNLWVRTWWCCSKVWISVVTSVKFQKKRFKTSTYLHHH